MTIANYAPNKRECYVDAESQLGLGELPLSNVEWNLLAVSSRSLFSWEDSKIPVDVRHADFDLKILAAAKETLRQRVGGHSVKKLVETMTPPELLLWFNSNDIKHLKLTEFWGGSKQYILIMEARTLAWLAVQKPDKKQKVIQLNPLTFDEITFVNSVNPWKNGEITWEA